MKNFLCAFGIAFIILCIISLINEAISRFMNWLKNNFPSLYVVLNIIILLIVTIFIWELLKR